MSTEKKKTKKAVEKDTGKETFQPVINVGLVGHVDHGKTTLLERMSGKWTDTHSEEIKRGITIRLGYADTSINYCEGCDEYCIGKCKKCKKKTVTKRRISFVDAPGHESLMATMLAGATIIDGALLLVAANEPCPQPQTREHLMALEIMGIKNIIVVQNKIDLVSQDEAIANYESIKKFLKGTSYEDCPIVPISAQHDVGMNNLLRKIEEHIPTPNRDRTKDPMFLVARSFDINKPGSKIDSIQGGVLGGSLIRGVLKKGMTIEIRPGYDVIEKNQRVFKPLHAKIIDLKTGNHSVDEITPGGSCGILTSLDPGIVKSDKLTGSVVGISGKLPDVHYSVKLETVLLERVVGSEKDLIVDPLKMTEALMLNVNSAATVGIVTDMGKKWISCKLKLPVCAETGARVTISRMIGNRFRLIGYGIIKK